MDTRSIVYVASLSRAVPPLRTLLVAAAAAGVIAAVLPFAEGGSAQAAAPTCVATAEGNQPASPSPGNSCWTEVDPYPFGYDGNPVNPNSAYCATDVARNSGGCYLTVKSMAFRAWNRGLALVEPSTPGSGATPFGVWRYNGVRWYPDPTFPGGSVCGGDKIIWAGKLDIWLVGGASLCRYDGVNNEWEPLAAPPVQVVGLSFSPSLTTGACFAWNNCWFFGQDGSVDHWDGNTLTAEVLGIGGLPTALPGSSAAFDGAAIGTDEAGSQFAIAVGEVGADVQADGSSPQALRSTGRAFSPLTLAPPPTGSGGDPNGTDLTAIGIDSTGTGWVAGNPADERAGGNWISPAPLLPIDSGGDPTSCPSTPADAFTYSENEAQPSYRWNDIAVMPNGSAIAGGSYAAGPAGNQTTQPLLEAVSCSSAPVAAEPLVPDSQASGTAGPGPSVMDTVTAVSASATNDAWAATNGVANNAGSAWFEVPELYQWTDGQTPDAPAGDDNESRPIVTTQEPTLFEFAPPVVVPPPPQPILVSRRGRRRHKTVRLKPAVYDIHKPHLAAASRGSFTLTITFRVRRKVTIGLDAVRHGRVVSSSGLKTFFGAHGSLSVRVTRASWPTGLKFVQPKAKK
jgi:hypothetical protein